MPFYLSFRTLKIAKQLGIPVIATFHIQVENILLNIKVKSPWAIKLLYHFFIKRFHNRCDHVIYPSQFAQNELLKYGLDTSSSVISNGVTENFKPEKVKLCNFLKNKFVILSVGRLAHEKQHHKIISAIQKSKHKHKI